MSVARPADWFQNGFHRFLGPYLKRHFHSIAMAVDLSPSRQWAGASPIDDPSMPMIVYSNHPSWWDPLMAHYINHRLFAPRQFYAPIDADALQQYKVFEKLGFFGVESNAKRGAAAFLKTAAELFERPGSALWITPEGRFADVRDVDDPLMPGLAHVCSRLTRGWVVPVALEYVFWEERLPECLFQFGEFIRIETFAGKDKTVWAEELRTRLRSAQSSLASLSIAHDSSRFDNLLQGRAGASGWYDFARRIQSRLTGRKFKAAHGEHFE